MEVTGGDPSSSASHIKDSAVEQVGWAPVQAAANEILQEGRWGVQGGVGASTAHK